MGPILIVEDNYDIRLACRRLLETNGYSVVSVASGSEALQALLHRPFSLILTDLYMPTMSGFEFMRQLRDLGMRAPPIVAMTAYEFLSSAEAGAAATALGARALLRKPLDPHLLLITVAHLLSEEPAIRDASEDEEKQA